MDGKPRKRNQYRKRNGSDKRPPKLQGLILNAPNGKTQSIESRGMLTTITRYGSQINVRAD